MDHINIIDNILKYLYNASSEDILEYIFEQSEMTIYWEKEINKIREQFGIKWLGMDKELKLRLIKRSTEYYS